MKTTENFCPIRHVLDRFGDKWSILVLMELKKNKVMRFNELNRTIPDISQKMLTVTLRTLEADALVMRKIYPEVPPRVEYQLTETGYSLIPHILNLVDWALEHKKAIIQSRENHEKGKTAYSPTC
ncbi:MAG: helix-turn-helix transcriptional regulator [Candidatus Symbiothrix sp.]|jgi:DNA-binding HxlR family transcriptional regulator|nr:helix-turn-helix transcriptional regulator [Candidatus Symbiothrix sp.]